MDALLFFCPLSRKVSCIMPRQKENIGRIIGLGFDNADGHVRLTRGKNFDIFLGSEPTHERMQELCIKLNERLDEKGKSLQSLSRDELMDILSEVDPS